MADRSDIDEADLPAAGSDRRHFLPTRRALFVGALSLSLALVITAVALKQLRM